MFHIHRHKFRELRKTTKLGLSRLIFAIGIAGIDTIWSIYMNSFGLSESTIGFISSILVLITLLSALFSTPLLEKLGEYKILIISLLITAISYFSIALTDNLILFLSFTTILVISGVFRINSFDILFRDEEDDDKKLNQDEGLMFTLLNIGWLIGPLVAGFIMATYSLKAVFVSSAIFILIGTVILIQSNLKYDKKINIKKKTR